VTQIIHDEDDDDEREVLARRWDAKWDARWYGLDWETTSGPSALHKLFYSFPPSFFSQLLLLGTFVTAAVKRARHIVKESVKQQRSRFLFRQKFSYFD